jgi:hypothetical protein
MYKVEGISGKANKFVSQNIELPIALGEGGPVVHTVEIDNRLRIMIEVTEDTTNQQIRDIAKIALEWQRRLLDFQGAWRGGGRNEALERLSSRQERGISYAKLANEINVKLANRLYDYVAYRKEVDLLFPELIQKHDSNMDYYIFWMEMKSNSASLSFAKGMLELFGMKQTEIDNCIREGLRMIASGDSPFLPNQPITRLKMIETLRTYREGRIHKSIQRVEQAEREEV